MYEWRSRKRLRLVIVSSPSLDYTLDPYLDDHTLKDMRLIQIQIHKQYA
jgi:hypothetical protein